MMKIMVLNIQILRQNKKIGKHTKEIVKKVINLLNK